MTSLQGFLYTLFGFLVSIVVLCSGNSTVALSDSVSMDTAKDNKAKPKLSASISMDTAKDSIAKPKSIDHANTVYQDCNNGSCSFADLRIECIDCIPINVSSAVNEIVLSHFNESRIAPHMFCAVSWPRVVNLTMLNSKGNLFHIKNFTFDCLPKIKTLTLGLRLLTNFSHNALYGLEDLQTFDLTDCIRLEIAGLLPGLSSKAIVPKLQTLILSKVGSAYGGVQLSQDFVDILAYRKVTNLDITSSYLGFEDTHVNVDGLCKCVERLNLTNSHLLHLQFVHPATCDSLRVIDVSGVTFPGTPVLPSNITILQAVITIFDSEWTEMLRSVSVIHANNLIPHYLFINNVTLSVRVNNSLTEIHFCGNSIPVFELKFKIDPNHVKYFDISNNRIELLSPDSLADLKHLKIIDLSNNSLAVSNQSEYIFASLFRNNSELEIARLTSNGFNDFPSNMFELNTELKQIDLTNNEFNQMPLKCDTYTIWSY